MAILNLSKVKFTNKADEVRSDHGIFNPKNSIVNTGEGADKIIATNSFYGDFGFGVLVGVGVNDLNSIIASAEFSGRASVATEGIKNKGIIKTGRGRDVVSGTATANISVTATTVSQAIAISESADTNVITNAFASIKFRATADGIDNSRGEINNGKGSDGIYGDTDGSIAAVATAYADASAIVEAIAQAPVSEGLTAFAGAIATSIAKAKIIARGINNKEGTITTRKGPDTISATATSSAATLSQAAAFTVASAPPENQALAQSVANAFAKVKDKAIAIDNTDGEIRTGNKADKITAYATGRESYGIYGGDIFTGTGADEVKASSFGGGVNIRMGKGADFVEGFGNASVDGGEGVDDQLSFGSYNKSDFNISLGANNGDAMFELDGITMKTTGFEQFTFADGSYSYDLLMG